MKRILFASMMVLLFSTTVIAQSWPTSSATRPSFSGFGITTDNESSSIFSDANSESESFAGDYITSNNITKAADDDWGEGEIGNPGTTVPIVESILGLLGLGGAYAWRLFRKKEKND